MKRHKALLLTACLVVFSLGAQAQRWVDLMLQEDANFYEIQEAFYEEWAGKSYVRGKGHKQFKRWEAFWETRINPDGTFPKYEDQWRSYKQFRMDASSRGGGSGGNWAPLGPFTYTNTDSWSPGQGRVNVIMEDPNNSNTIYLGAPAGGIWKTTDGGSTWVALGDDLPVIGISGIAVDPNNSNIVYIATGDNDGGDTYSIGVYKSTDGGTTWNPTGSINANSTNKVMVDPSNSNTVWVATSGGMYKSTNGGTSWSQSRSGNFDDMDMKPGDPQTLYAVTNNTLYRTTNGGGSWSAATGLPSSSGRLKLCVTEANSNYVYVVSANTGYSFQGIYRSTNSGSSFNAMNTTTDVFNGSSQAWFDLDIACSNTNENTLTVGCLNVWRSTNGGTSWNQLNNWSSPNQASYTHADIHFLEWYDGRLYCGSDGGIYRSTNNGTSFTSLTDGVQIGQFYTIAGTQQTPDVLCGGLQDNGGYAWTNGTWKVYYGADGMGSAVDPNDPDLIFGMIQYGDLYFSNNGGNTNGGLGSPEQGAWVTPMVADPNNDRILAGYSELYEYDYTNGWNQLSNNNFGTLRHVEVYEGNSNIIYVATSSNIYRSNNNGSSFTNVSNNITGTITSIEIHPTDPDKVWISIGGTGSAKVYETTSGGSSWQNISGNLPNINTNIVVHEPGTADALYIGTDIGVYYRDDNLGSWIPYMTNLPNVIVNDLEIHVASGVIRAGSYGRGVWESGTYNQPVVADDAGISAIKEPSGTVCGVNFDPVVTLENYGTNALTSVDIYYSIDNGTPAVFNWTGNLGAQSNVDVTLPTQSITVGGFHDIDVYTDNPNATVDGNPFNDDFSNTFNIDVSGGVVDVNLITDCFGYEVYWEVRDQSNSVVGSGGNPVVPPGGQQGANANDAGAYANNDTIVTNLCLEDGCYDLILYDDWGDGLFGSQWQSCTVDGDFSITDGQGAFLGQLANVDYGSDTTFNFCVTVPITAAFTSNKTTICEGLNINFTDQSIGNATSWQWSFPGGSPATSTNQNVTVNYASVGTYDVTLIVSDGTTTDTLTLSAYIDVVTGPTATTSSTDENCAGNCNGSVTATATGGSSPYTYTWSNGLGNGGTIMSVCPGTYNLVLTDANGCVFSGVSATVNAGAALPTVDASASDTIVFLDQGGQVDFTNLSTGATSFDWDFDDGNNSTANDPTHTYTSAGVYTVTLTGTSDDNCSADWMQDIYVYVAQSVEEAVLDAAVSLFPNPTDGALNIQLEESFGDVVQVEVFNALGEVVETTTIQPGQQMVNMDLSAHSKGLYYLTISVNDTQITRKVSLMK